MKTIRLTQRGLQQLIKEEISRGLRGGREAVGEATRPFVREVPGTHGRLWHVDASALLEFAKAYAQMGWAVQDQLHRLMDEGLDANLNGNAVDIMEEKLGMLNDEISGAIQDWKRSNIGPDDED